MDSGNNIFRFIDDKLCSYISLHLIDIVAIVLYSAYVFSAGPAYKNPKDIQEFKL